MEVFHSVNQEQNQVYHVAFANNGSFCQLNHYEVNSLGPA